MPSCNTYRLTWVSPTLDVGYLFTAAPAKKHLFLLYWLMAKPSTVWITIKCGKFWKRWEYKTHLTCLLRNLYAGQEVTVKTGHGTTDWFQIGKGVCQGCILSPCLCNLYEEYIIRNAGLHEVQAESRLPGKISIMSDIQMTPPLWQKVKKY